MKAHVPVVGLVLLVGCASLRPVGRSVRVDGETIVRTSYVINPDASGSAALPILPVAPFLSDPHKEADCDSYDKSYAMWGGIAAGSGALSGLGGLGAALKDDDKTVRISLGVTALIIGGMSATSVFLSQHYASRYTERCVQEK